LMTATAQNIKRMIKLLTATSPKAVALAVEEIGVSSSATGNLSRIFCFLFLRFRWNLMSKFVCRKLVFQQAVYS
ncbi:MAG TPA: hypothetical protein HPP56_08035, partial [Nitrospirae bacterium]|nr:hypothetical protein [Nitrospirota bacterium]